MDSQRLMDEMELILSRYRGGLISLAQARQETAMLESMLRLAEMAGIEERLRRIEDAMEERKR